MCEKKMFDLNKIVLSATVSFFLFTLSAYGAPPPWFDNGQTGQNDEIVSTVVDMNGSNTSAILNQFNISRADVERKLDRISESDAVEGDESRR